MSTHKRRRRAVEFGVRNCRVKPLGVEIDHVGQMTLCAQAGTEPGRGGVRKAARARMRDHDQYSHLQESQLAKRGRLAIADDEVIEHADIDQRQRVLQPPRELAVGRARLHDAGGVIVRKDDGRGIHG